MFTAWFALTFQAAQLGLDAQNVIALRLLRLSGGGAAGLEEARLMVADKMAALTEAQLAVTTGLLTGDNQLPKKVLWVFTKRVRANRKRLSNRRKAT